MSFAGNLPLEFSLINFTGYLAAPLNSFVVLYYLLFFLETSNKKLNKVSMVHYSNYAVYFDIYIS